MACISFPSAPDAIRHSIEAGVLKAGSWGDGTDAVCMMSAIVNGAHGIYSCVTAGWPEWLVRLNVYLFDADVWAEDEDKARAKFALDVALAVSKTFNADKARDLFLIRRLDTGEHSALKSLRLNPVDADWWRNCEAAVLRVVDLLKRRINGEDVAEEMRQESAAAGAAARAADCAAADAVAYAAARAAGAAGAAADAAARAAVDAAACAAADAVAYAAARAAAYAASHASAHAAARADLIASIIEARIDETYSTVTGE